MSKLHLVNWFFFVLQESITRLAEVEGNQVFAMDLQKMVNTTLSEVETADVRSRATVEATRVSSQRDVATAVVRTFVTLGAIGAHFGGFWCIVPTNDAIANWAQFFSSDEFLCISDVNVFFK